MGFNPRKRAVKEVPRIKSWSSDDGSPALQGLVGYKAGMAHAMMVNNEVDSPHKGTEESVPVTVVETPPVRAVALRAYEQTPYGMKPQTEVWVGEFYDELDRVLDLPAEDTFDSDADALREAVEVDGVDDLRVITHTVLSESVNVLKKKPDVMETRAGGGFMVECADFVLDLATEGGEHGMFDVFRAGEYFDAVGVTKGKGAQGPVKQWGIQKRRGKHVRQGWRCRIGNLGPWNLSRARSTVPQLGQTGYHQHIELNKRPIDLGEDDDASAEGDFVNCGEVDDSYALIKGSLPGPNKRPLRLRPAIRPSDQPRLDPEACYVPITSNRG